MSDVTLSPIPYNGGALSLTNANSHICHLSDNKFFALFGQTTPNLMFAATFTISDMHGASPTISVLKQRAMSSTPLTRARVWKLNDTCVLALVNADLKVYEIQADGDIVEKSASISAFHSTYLWGLESATLYGIGTHLLGQTIKDNTVWFIQRTATTSAITLFKIVYDPASDTLVKTALVTLQASTTATHFWRHSIVKIPGSTNYLVYGLGGGTTPALSSISAYRIFTEDGALVDSQTAGIPSTIKALVPLKQNRILGLKTTRTYLAWNGASWTTNDAYLASSYTAVSVIMSVIPFDDQNFMFCASSVVDPYTGAWFYRVSRYISDILAQSSAATDANSGITYTTANIFYDQQAAYVIDDYETILLFGISSTTAFSVRIIYQPKI